jgi:histidinol-phosphate aminotransferase
LKWSDKLAIDFYSRATAGVATLNPYRPGKPASELQRELGLTDIVSLASNENPFGPSVKALNAATEALTGMTRYPDPTGYRLKQAIAERFDLAVDQLTLGNGSNELLNILARILVEPGQGVVYSQYGFVAYEIAARVAQAKRTVVAASGFGHDLAAIAGQVDETTRLVFLANPNNPTGTSFDRSEFSAFMQRVPEQVVVVLDEAYSEYVEPEADLPDGLSLVKEYGNLVVTRTFSKAYGLAGLRVGFASANPELTDLMNRVREPFNVNCAALAAAEASLFDGQYLERVVQTCRAGKAQLLEGLSHLGVSVLPSQGNFLTLDLGQDSTGIYQSLLREGVIVRPLHPYDMPNHLRVTVGLEAENERCLQALKKVLSC